MLQAVKSLIQRFRQFRRNTFPTAAEQRIDGYNFAVDFCKEYGFERGTKFLWFTLYPPLTPFDEGVLLFLEPGDIPCVTSRLKRFS